MPDTIVITRRCPFCQQDHTVEVDPHGYALWKRGAFIQNALPELTPAQREILISGVDDACWQRAFPPEED